MRISDLHSHFVMQEVLAPTNPTLISWDHCKPVITHNDTFTRLILFLFFGREASLWGHLAWEKLKFRLGTAYYNYYKQPRQNGGHIINKWYYKQPKKLVGICSELQATKATADSFVFNSGMYLGAGLSNPRHRQLVKLDKKGGYKMSVPRWCSSPNLCGHINKFTCSDDVLITCSGVQSYDKQDSAVIRLGRIPLH
jgi:hypothetical protein